MGTDYADLFEIKDVVRDRSAEIRKRHEPKSGSITFHYRNGRFEARTHVKASRASIEGDAFVWQVELEPRGHFETTVEIEAEHSVLLHELAGKVDESKERGRDVLRVGDPLDVVGTSSRPSVGTHVVYVTAVALTSSGSGAENPPKRA